LIDALLWLAVGLPLAGALVTRLACRWSGAASAGAAAIATVPAWVLLVAAAGDERLTSGLEWLPAGDGLDVGLRLDGLSAAMTATVATVGLVVVVYSWGYFAGHPRATSARAWLLAFLAAMQGLVLADGFLTLLIFWELVGALSARLIAFSREDPSAPGGAVRAFLTTRAADVGLYIAVPALLAGSGTLAFDAERPEGALGAVVGLGLVASAMGKSAQVPVQTWLSGAMAGPTPVSALLHSATMVAAGVYLLVRSDALLAGWPLELAGWVGGVTAVAGAAIALAQTDLKRVLAGSTTSQLGLMFVGAAAGGPAVALFHLVAHAAGKAGLFLATGVFQHRRGSTSLDALRGVGREDRAAFAIFAISALSIAAVPPLAAFWSKDAIVVAAEENAGWLALVLISAAGSAAYLLRPGLLLWRGDAQGHEPAGRRTMLIAAGALVAASAVLGAIGEPLADLVGGELEPVSATGILLSLAAVTLGALVVLAGVRVPARLADAGRRQLYINELLDAAVVRPARGVGRAAAWLDDHVIDAAVDGIGRATLAAARSQRWIEDRGVDAAVDGLAALVGRSGRDITRVQTGRLYEYLRNTVAGIAAIALIVTLTALL
jgi:NADH-quinone oxidoreductase subunit L